MAEDEHLGLIQLWPAVDSNIPTRLDIIAVHGLGGHPLKTWTEGERLWLRDFLPNSIPEARVSTYGYDSGIAFDKSASEIPDFARDLLERVRALRRKGQESALVIAHERERYKDVLDSVQGVIFLGTPHRGADIAYWSRILGKIANVPLLGSIRTNLLKDLQLKSTVLGDICSQFVERGKRLQIFSFYERVKTSGINDLVVDQDSAILHLPNETPLPMEADHRGICKFLTANNQRYLLVLNSLQELVEEAEDVNGREPSQAELHFLNKLCDVDPKLPFDQIPTPHEGTCGWANTNPMFQQWATSSSSAFLWISGFAGSGKSVLTKYIINHLIKIRRSESAKVLRKTTGEVAEILCFTFCSDKESRGNDAAAVLRSILFQVLSQNHKLFRYLDKDDLSSFHQDLTPQILTDILSKLILKGRNTKYWILVDALDEMTANSATVLLRHLGQIMETDLVGRVRILVTSRQEPGNSLQHMSVPGLLTLDLGAVEVQRDVEAFIANLVNHSCTEHSFPAAMMEEVKRTIISRSHGLFLLASLNWTAFSEGISYWNKRMVLSRLQELERLPATFESLYCSLLERIPLDFQPLLKKIFMWLLVARQPMKLRDLRHAICVEPHHRSYQELEDDLVYGLEQLIRKICSQFLKIGGQDEVQFRHQSVKEMLLQRSPIQVHETILQQYRASLSACEYHVNSVCLNILSWDDFSHGRIRQAMDYWCEITKQTGGYFYIIEDLYRQLPMTLYLARFWPSHLQSVQDEPELLERAASFFLSPSLSPYRMLREVWREEEKTRRSLFRMTLFDNATPPLHALVQMGDFVEIAQQLISSGQPVNQVDANLRTPLHWAIAMERRRIFRRLVYHPKVDPNAGLEGKDKPIHLCIDPRSQPLDFFEALVSSSKVSINSRGSGGQTPLHRIIQVMDQPEPWLDLVLRREEIDVNIQDDDGIVPLIRALSLANGQKATLKLLQLPPTALNVAVTDQTGTNALSLASMRGWVDIRKILQRRDRSQVFSLNYDGMNALTRAAFSGQKTTLEGLLQDCTAEDFRRYKDQGRFHLVNLCAQQDWEDVVERLQTEYGLESQEQDDRGRTILHWAAFSGWSQSCLVRSDGQRAMVNVQDHDGRTALHLAAENRNVEAAKTLLKAGASCVLRDKNGKTAAHTAADAGSRAILELLLTSSVQDFGDDDEGRSLLHCIAAWEWTPVLAMYLARNDAVVDAMDKRRRTALHFAAIYGNAAMIKMLIENGAKIHLRDSLGFTAAQHAIQQGHSVDTLSRLVMSNTDLFRLDAFHRTTIQIALGARQHHLVHFLISKGVAINTPDRKGRTALHKATYTGDVNIIMALLQQEADVTAMDDQGWTPLHHAVFAEDLPIVQELLAHPRTFPSAQNHRGHTPLDLAAIRSHDPIIGALQSHGAIHSSSFAITLHPDTGAPSSNPPSPSMLAVVFSQAAEDQLLKGKREWHKISSMEELQKLAIRLRDEDMTARLVHRGIKLHDPSAFLLFPSNETVLPKLFDQGADPNVRDEDGNTPLHLWLDEPEALSCLIEHGAQVNAVNRRGQTPLFVAVLKHGPHWAASLQVLMGHGANPFIRGLDGNGHWRSALEVVRMGGHLMGVEILMEAQERAIANGIVPPIESDPAESRRPESGVLTPDHRSSSVETNDTSTERDLPENWY